MSELQPAPRSFPDKLSHTGPPAAPWVHQRFPFSLSLSPPDLWAGASPTWPAPQHSAGQAGGAPQMWVGDRAIEPAATTKRPIGRNSFLTNSTRSSEKCVCVHMHTRAHARSRALLCVQLSTRGCTHDNKHSQLCVGLYLLVILCLYVPT